MGHYRGLTTTIFCVQVITFRICSIHRNKSNCGDLESVFVERIKNKTICGNKTRSVLKDLLVLKHVKDDKHVDAGRYLSSCLSTLIHTVFLFAQSIASLTMKVPVKRSALWCPRDGVTLFQGRNYN